MNAITGRVIVTFERATYITYEKNLQEYPDDIRTKNKKKDSKPKLPIFDSREKSQSPNPLINRPSAYLIAIQLHYALNSPATHTRRYASNNRSPQPRADTESSPHGIPTYIRQMLYTCVYILSFLFPKINDLSLSLPIRYILIPLHYAAVHIHT